MDSLLTYSNSIETCLSAADLCELLAVAFEPPTLELARGLDDGSFCEDVFACLRELGVPADQVAEIEASFAEAKGVGAGKVVDRGTNAVSDADAAQGLNVDAAATADEGAGASEDADRDANADAGEDGGSVADGRVGLTTDEGERAERLLAALKHEYSHLFAHPKHPTVWRYETMFKEEAGASKEPPSLFISPTCLHVESLMKRAGVSVGADNKQPADFVANELHFASYLFTQCAMDAAASGGSEAQGLNACDGEAAGEDADVAARGSGSGSDEAASPSTIAPNQTKSYGLLTDLCQYHLASWLPDFLQQVAEKSAQPLYRICARAGLLMLGA